MRVSDLIEEMADDNLSQMAIIMGLYLPNTSNVVLELIKRYGSFDMAILVSDLAHDLGVDPLSISEDQALGQILNEEIQQLESTYGVGSDFT